MDGMIVVIVVIIILIINHLHRIINFYCGC